MWSMTYERSGSGPPLLLIHGVGHHGRGWRPVTELLKSDFDVITPDSPGFGSSPPLPSGTVPTITAHADAFAGFIEELGLERPHVAGNSMGGAIGLELARRGLAGSVTAISPAGFWTKAELRYAQALLGTFARMPRPMRPSVRAIAGTRAGRLALFNVLFARPAAMPPEVARELLDRAWAAPAFAHTLGAFDHYRFGRGEELRGTPITVAWGSKDRLLFYRPQSARARAELPEAEHVTMPGVGHTPFWDDPAMTAAVIKAGAPRAI